MVSIRVLCICALFQTGILAQDPAKVHFVRASGESVVMAKPDQARISIGVSTLTPTAQAGSEQNAKQTTEVLNAVKQALGSAGELRTTGYSISPEYQYANGQAPKLTGYRASSTVEVTVNDLAMLGKVIDVATGSGANNINGISFTLRNDESARAEALAAAATKARSNAEAIAKALNVRVISLLQAETIAEPGGRPALFEAAKTVAFAAERQATPIEAGNLEIRATVTVSLEVQ